MDGLILASTSRYRRALIERLGISFTIQAPDVNEDDVKQSGDSPLAIAQELARRKAQAVFANHPNDVVIGSDQVVCIQSHIFDKPGNADNAIAQLRQLRGQEHRLITAVAIAYNDKLVEFIDTTRLVMRDLSDDEIDRYVRAEDPSDCAGSYKIEGLGITLFERIDGRDHTAITGLPLLQLCHELRQLDVPLP